MSKIDNLYDLFVEEISDIYNAEKQLTKALPKMAKHASNPQLKAGFEKHLAETEDQLAKLDKVADICDFKFKSITCEAMKGLIKEGGEAFDEFAEGPVRDVALIIAAQKVEHYEISGYGSLCALADKLGWTEAKTILRSIEEQEAATDKKLTELSKAINEDAADLAEAAE